MNIRERAHADVADHRLSVLMDEGRYKHLLFKKPGASEFWFEVITYPGTLTVRGDMGAYVFAREDDMISWFIGSSNGGRANVDYWAEKCVTHGRRGLKEYSEQVMRQRIAEAVNDLIQYEDLDLDQTVELRRALADHLDDVDLGDQRDAQRDVADFEWQGHQPFSESWEWDPTEYTYQFQWTAHTLLIALQAYRAHQASKAAAAPVTSWEADPQLQHVFRTLARSIHGQPEYSTTEARMAYTEGVEHALSTVWAKQYRDVTALVAAYKVPGPAPAYHRAAQEWLYRNWTTLNNALTAITTTTKGHQ